MIARLEGRLAEKSPERLILDVGGVGYEIHAPLSTFLELPDEGKTVRLRVHTHVRQDTFQLYGFLSEGERVGFRLLLGIAGVGPRLALGILSGLSTGRLVQAIRRADVEALRSIPGVGLKTAERMLVELRDKVDRLELDEPASPTTDAEAATVSALLNLGYPRAQAEKLVRAAVERLPPGSRLEDLVREALRAAGR